MKATELRIGNWVYETEFIGAEKVWSIETELVDGEQSINDCPISTIKPIHLTEEWLKKFGFENDLSQDTPEYRLTNKWVCKSFVIYTDWVGEQLIYENTSIRYVHQLQNLYFALTGEELIPNQ